MCYISLKSIEGLFTFVFNAPLTGCLECFWEARGVSYIDLYQGLFSRNLYLAMLFTCEVHFAIN